LPQIDPAGRFPFKTRRLSESEAKTTRGVDLWRILASEAHMTARLVLRSFLPALAAGTIAAGLAAAPQNARESRERTVFVSAVTKDNVPVPGLGVDDFKITEDGKAREVLRVAQAKTPMQIALLLDNSQAVEPLVMDLRKAAAAFVQRVMDTSPGTEMSVWTFGERPVTEVNFTTSTVALLRGAGGVISRSQSGAYMLQAVPDASRALKKIGATRPVIVVFASEQGPEFGDNRAARVIEAVKASGATVWSIAFQGSGLTPYSNTPEGRERMEVLNTVTVDSGGENRGVLAASEPTFISVATMLTSQYEVTYGRPVSMVPPTKMTVTVSRPNVRLWSPHWAPQ
jgi:hypothetical protein